MHSKFSAAGYLPSCSGINELKPLYDYVVLTHWPTVTPYRDTEFLYRTCLVHSLRFYLTKEIVIAFDLTRVTNFVKWVPMWSNEPPVRNKCQVFLTFLQYYIVTFSTIFFGVIRHAAGQLIPVGADTVFGKCTFYQIFSIDRAHAEGVRQYDSYGTGQFRQREHRCRTPRTGGSVVPVRQHE